MTDYYLNFKQITEDLSQKEKSLRLDLSSFKETIGKGANTIELEKKIKEALKSFKDLVDKLNDAYLPKNAPGNMPDKTLEARQKEIKKYLIDYDNMEKDYKDLVKDKYTFKGKIEEDYRNKEEYKNMGTGELLQLEKKKLNQQDDKIDEITSDAKKGTQLAKNFEGEIHNQNENIKQVNEDMERLDTRMNKLTLRFNKYVNKAGYCCLITCFIFEVLILIGLVVLLCKLKDPEKPK